MDDGNGAGARNGIQVIGRAAAVLRALKDDPSGLSLGQIADRVALPRSTVQRIVAALQEERLVIASSQGNGVRLGPELHALARAARYNIVDRCRPYLTEMRDRIGETVDLSVLRAGRMIFLDQVQGSHRLRTISSVGEVFPLTTTANGRACLALLPEAEAQSLAFAEWGSAGDWPALQRRLVQVRATGLRRCHRRSARHFCADPDLALCRAAGSRHRRTEGAEAGTDAGAGRLVGSWRGDHFARASTKSCSTVRNGPASPVAAVAAGSVTARNSAIRLSLTPNTASEWI
jgi:DNA-binding IclR family transcriptional regulator